MSNILTPIVVFIGLGIGAGVLLTIFSNVFAVKIDERVEALSEALPGLNCGACGFSGCAGYAEALAKDPDLKTTLCTPGGGDVGQKISSILGTSFQEVEPIVAEIYCQGTSNVTSDLFAYEGIDTCHACNLYFSGNGKCNYGCLGFGDCKAVCQFGAIEIVDGLARINPELCTGCNMCVTSCPKKIIGLRKKSAHVRVKCKNGDTGRFTRTACSVGCIGCKKCEKTCPHDAIHVEQNKAVVDYDKCTRCGACVPVCPVHCIVQQ